MGRMLYILGTGGLAREIAMLAEQINARNTLWEGIGLISQSNTEIGKVMGNARVVGDDEWVLSQTFKADIAVAIGHPHVKHFLTARYLEHRERFSFPNLVHPKVDIDLGRVMLGVGNIITIGCVLTCEVNIGDFNLFNWNTTVGHDVNIGSFNVFNPSVNLSGYVRIDDKVLVGAGSQILEHISVGSGVIIGAGAVVTKNVSPGLTIAGVPAKVIGPEIG